MKTDPQKITNEFYKERAEIRSRIIPQATKLICEIYSVTQGELLSRYIYKPLPVARLTYVYILKRLGLLNFEISQETGFSPPRITQAIRRVEVMMSDDDLYEKMIDRILKGLKDE